MYCISSACVSHCYCFPFIFFIDAPILKYKTSYRQAQAKNNHFTEENYIAFSKDAKKVNLLPT